MLAPDLNAVVDAKNTKSKSMNTPFDGWELRREVAATIAGGKTVYSNPKVGLPATPPASEVMQKALRVIQECLDQLNVFHFRIRCAENGIAVNHLYGRSWERHQHGRVRRDNELAVTSDAIFDERD